MNYMSQDYLGLSFYQGRITNSDFERYAIENRTKYVSRLIRRGMSRHDAEETVQEFLVFISRNSEGAIKAVKMHIKKKYGAGGCTYVQLLECYDASINWNIRNICSKFYRDCKNTHLTTSLDFINDTEVSFDQDKNSLLRDENSINSYYDIENRDSRRDFWEIIRKELPEKLFLVLEYIYIHEMPFEEIAKILDIPIGTVKSRHSNARNALKKTKPLFEKMITA